MDKLHFYEVEVLVILGKILQSSGLLAFSCLDCGLRFAEICWKRKVLHFIKWKVCAAAQHGVRKRGAFRDELHFYEVEVLFILRKILQTSHFPAFCMYEL